MTKKGKIFIISAPSGCGKTTLGRQLLRSGAGLTESVSMTTRPRRGAEREGGDYYFVTKKRFQEGIRRGRFLEWTRTYGWYYGTPKAFVNALLKKGKGVLLNIDVKGAMNVKRRYPGSVLIFIAPPSLKALKQRLIERNLDDKKEIKKRLTAARNEMSYLSRYDYCVVNDRIEDAAEKLKAIVIANTCKVR